MKRNFIAFRWFFTSFDNIFPMTRLLPILLLCSVTGSGLAQETWIQMSSPTGTGRHHPITVANDQYGYVIAGQAGFASLNLDDVHRYDPAGDTWEQMEAFPGGGRGYGYGVSEGDNAFVGFGSNDGGYPTDWWRLDMASGLWTAMADFPGPGRNHPAMVLTAGKVFVGLGSNSDGNLGDWWGYDIAANTWEELAPFTAGNRHHPFYFGIDGTAYVGFGHGDTQNGNLTIYRDFHAYNPANNSWTQLGDFPGEARVAGTQFAAQGKGYVLSGDGDDHGPLDNGEFWEYDPQTDNWDELPAHPGGARWAPGSFVLGCHVYLTGGLEGTADVFHHDLWRYSLLPDCGCTDDSAFNFSSVATIDDGSCCFLAGCLQETAINYNPEACFGDGSCIAPVLGCTDETSDYYDPEANTEVAIGGPMNLDELGAGGFHFNDNWDMLFSVSEPTILASVDVFAETAFGTSVYIKNAAGATLFQENVGLSAGWNTLDLDIELPNGTNYAMGIEGDNEGLFRNNAVPEGSFPIAVADRMTITANTTDEPQAYYYYFYRWTLESPCASPSSVTNSENPWGVFPNPTQGGVWVTGVTDRSDVKLTDASGRAVWASTVVLTGRDRLTWPAMEPGLYFLSVDNASGHPSKRIVIR